MALRYLTITQPQNAYFVVSNDILALTICRQHDDDL